MKRDYPDRPIIGVGAVIIEDGRVLVVKRATEPLKGQWSIPGGAVELGETLREAASREAREETGLIIEAGEVLEVFDSIYRDAGGRTQYHYVLVDFLCRRLPHPNEPKSGSLGFPTSRGELRAATDVSEARWITLDELPGLQMTQTAERVIRKALAQR
jgi:8-oxo-dGTP diphosphatase